MKASRVRLAVQLAFLGFMSWVGYRHQLLGGRRPKRSAAVACER